MSLGERAYPRIGSVVSVALETNNKGFLGYIVELPGAFIRGRTEQESLSKVRPEVASYLRWLGHDTKTLRFMVRLAQRHQCELTIEDADSEILLDADRTAMAVDEFKQLVGLVKHSGQTFLRLYENARFKEWVDEARVRKTFYGDDPKTIHEIRDHVKRVQYYYLSRTRVSFETKEQDFMRIREYCLGRLVEVYQKDGNSSIFSHGEETWTVKKILRRFIWHDRIHGRAIARILWKQRDLGVIDAYDDPFFFELTPTNR